MIHYLYLCVSVRWIVISLLVDLWSLINKDNDK